MTETVFKVLFADLGEKLKNSIDAFEALSEEKQCLILLGLLKILHCNAEFGDLSSIGIKSNGKIRLGKNISSGKFKSVKLINQSVTGLFEQEIELI